ncbi:hypothetical protein CEXT_648061 [Caerostris extrusa]|uniref:Uncharacterized protein n=1 Tax=Caerostris extrusa TaxID=172846 RepID=A0AAV4XX46_CAEEX|nr:hypothetical protein CEXT_648061 [Caerostris extrusa]
MAIITLRYRPKLPPICRNGAAPLYSVPNRSMDLYPPLFPAPFNALAPTSTHSSGKYSSGMELATVPYVLMPCTWRPKPTRHSISCFE